MNILHESKNGLALAADGNEYRIGKPVKQEDGKVVIQAARHYYCVEYAVKAYARLVANDEAQDLWEWLSMFNEVCEAFKA